jgi:hypothetical protein
MGIDEIHLIRLRCTVSNIDSRTAVEILPDRNRKSVINYLSRMKGREFVKIPVIPVGEDFILSNLHYAQATADFSLPAPSLFFFSALQLSSAVLPPAR